jgi:DNA repair protein RecN (Recombination protein N)
MLALRTALRGSGGAQILVFDEVDSGVGGVVLDAVADRLAALARGDRQVLCVTHQARIAARARLHVQVDKQTRAGRTSTRLQALDRRGRLAELERMLAGRRPGPRAAALAEELLARHEAGVV